MAHGTTRGILAEALTAGLVLCAPLAASAAEPSHVSLSALYEAVQVPSMVTELTLSAVVGPGVPVYSEPASNGTFTHALPRVEAIGAGKEGVRVRVSKPFTAGNEQWVAVQVPESAHGTDTAKSTLAAPGVAYMRAGSAQDARIPETAKAPATETYPQKLSDLITTTHLGGAVGLYSKPVESLEYDLKSATNEWGSSLKSSNIFTHEGREWVAIQAPAGLTATGIAYISADKRFASVEQPVKAQASATAPAATSTATPSAAPAATSAAGPSADTAGPSAEPSALAPAAEASSGSSNPFMNALTKWPAVLFAAMVMAGTLYITKRRTA